MTYKWNASEAGKYSKEFSELICSEFFTSKKLIEGNEIISLTEVKQLNLLIIKSLYDEWQAETNSIKSPYFDYSNTEVQSALATFMNTLSRYIAVDEMHFKPLLAKAVLAVLELSAEPVAYFQHTLKSLPDFKFTNKWIVENKKYFPQYSGLFDFLTKKTDQQGTVYVNEAVDWIKAYLDEHPSNTSQITLEEMNGILGLPKPAQESKSFFDDTMLQAAAPAPVASINTSRQQTNSSAPATDVVYKTPVKTSSEPVSLNDKHVSLSRTLNENVINEKPSLLDKHTKSKIGSLRDGLSLNQRFIFINRLFNGDQDSFLQTLEVMDSYSSMADTKNYVLNDVAQKFDWNTRSVEVEEFLNHIERKYA